MRESRPAVSAEPQPAAPVVIDRVSIIGAGPQGSQLAALAARCGYNVTLEDLLPAKLRRAAVAIESQLGRDSAITYASSVEEAAREADLVIDFVPDELESKLEIFSLLDRMAPPRTILATPTQTLSIADLASCTYRADRCVGLRFSGSFAKRAGSDEHNGRDPDAWAAVSTSLEVEMAHAPQVSEVVLAALGGFWQRLGARVAFSVDMAALP